MNMYSLLEQSDVFVDACVADQRTQLLFISAYGRDTSLQQFMARLHQPVNQGGVDSVTVRKDGEKADALKVLVGDARRLEKITGRMPKAGLLGNLVHAWIFDPIALQVDHATRSAWLLDNEGTDKEAADRRVHTDTWQLVKELSPVPMLEAWRDLVLLHLRVNGGLLESPSVGPIKALRIELPEAFPDWISYNVREGVLEVADRPGAPVLS
jgi:hypothetical protein